MPSDTDYAVCLALDRKAAHNSACRQASRESRSPESSWREDPGGQSVSDSGFYFGMQRGVVRVFATSYAVYNCLGATTERVLERLRDGRHGLSVCPLDLPFEALCGVAPSPAAEPADSQGMPVNRQIWLAQQAFFGVQDAVQRAVESWGAHRVGAVLGTSTGGIASTERAYFDWQRTSKLASDYELDAHSFHAAGRVLRKAGGWRGPTYVVSTACSSSTKVFAAARRMIRSGVCDAVLVGGVDSLALTTVRGFHSLSAASEGLCRPFSAARDGMNVGEGAALVLLERDRKALVELLGVGESSDAFHMSAPDPTGRGAAMAMRGALADAGLTGQALGFVNAHGTGTVRNDSAEALALTQVVGTNVPVVSTKSYTGHLLGAAGATEAVFTIAGLEQGWVPANLRLDPVDPEIALHLPEALLEGDFEFAMSNSLAFGGNNASLVFGRVA